MWGRESPTPPQISIHAPRRGSDRLLLAGICAYRYFNPRSPQGERLLPGDTFDIKTSNFNPRSPQGERQQAVKNREIYAHFNPRSPQGERLDSAMGNGSDKAFQSTLPAGGATL